MSAFALDRATTGSRGLTLVGPVVVVAATAAAYHHSFVGLWRLLPTGTPLAYLGLVPLLALAVAIALGRRASDEERREPHRHVDWMVGLPLLLIAAFIAALLPQRLSYTFWTNRIDLLGLPFFVGGLVALVLGTRVLRRILVAVVALVLSWPLPYEQVLDRVLGFATATTLAAVRALSPAVGVPRSGGSLFTLGQGSDAFVVNVAPQCAGANSSLGFLLVGGALAAVSTGARWRRLVWLSIGTAAMAIANVGRILVVFFAGDRYGEEAAIDWLHPHLGLVIFSAVTFAMVWLLPRFGIRLHGPRRSVDHHAHPARRRLRIGALMVAIAATAPLVPASANLRRFDPFVGVAAASTRPSLAGAAARPLAGWVGSRTDTITWAKPYFGPSSTWDRFTYTSVRGERATVFVDVVSTDDLGAFSRYGLEACYRVHGHEIAKSGMTDIRAASPAQTMTYEAGGRMWSVVAWVAPVVGGGATRFERVVTIAPHTSTPAAAEARALAVARELAGGG